MRAWHPTSFTKYPDRLLTAPVTGVFFESIRGEAEAKRLLSKKHSSVDGTLIEVATSLPRTTAANPGQHRRRVQSVYIWPETRLRDRLQQYKSPAKTGLL
jgi:hypothetical protein